MTLDLHVLYMIAPLSWLLQVVDGHNDLLASVVFSGLWPLAYSLLLVTDSSTFQNEATSC